MIEYNYETGRLGGTPVDEENRKECENFEHVIDNIERNQRWATLGLTALGGFVGGFVLCAALFW